MAAEKERLHPRGGTRCVVVRVQLFPRAVAAKLVASDGRHRGTGSPRRMRGELGEIRRSRWAGGQGVRGFPCPPPESDQWRRVLQPAVLPDQRLSYLGPTGVRFTGYFPFITLPAGPPAAIGGVDFFFLERSSSVLTSMPLLVGLAFMAVVGAGDGTSIPSLPC